MRILFGGEAKGESGPQQINRGILRNLSDSFWCVGRKNRYWKTMEGLYKTLLSDVVVLSGVTRFGCILMGFALLTGKKTVYIMHGCNEAEAEINQIPAFEKALRQERFLMKHVDLLLPVSELFQQRICERYPQYAAKTAYLHNGIDLAGIPLHPTEKRIPGSILAAGGSLKIKNNAKLAQAVEELCGSMTLQICGHWETDREVFLHTRFSGQRSHEDFLAQLRKTELFVVNSLFETYSIASVEALLCGCSVLISDAAGIAEILPLEENDRIHDPMDTEEIKRKILWLHEHPNRDRILSQLDLREISVDRYLEQLEEICGKLLEEKRK